MGSRTPYGYRHHIKGRPTNRKQEPVAYFLLAVASAVVVYIVLASF